MRDRLFCRRFWSKNRRCRCRARFSRSSKLPAAASMATLNIVAGHSGTFVKVSPTEIWKVRARAPRPSRRALCPPASPRGAQLTDKPERQMLRTLMASPELKSLVPAYLKDVPLDQWPASAAQQPGEDSACLELQDLTAGFECPCVMDVKIGTRTFLEGEVSNPKVRADLLAKMDKLDSGAATAAERASVSTAPSAPPARPLSPLRQAKPARTPSSRDPAPALSPRRRAASRRCGTCNSASTSRRRRATDSGSKASASARPTARTRPGAWWARRS